jgi:hypothetical protein
MSSREGPPSPPLAPVPVIQAVEDDDESLELDLDEDFEGFGFVGDIEDDEANEDADDEDEEVDNFVPPIYPPVELVCRGCGGQWTPIHQCPPHD